MEESQIILNLHEELLKTNRDLKYFKEECVQKFNKQKKVNSFLICCLISIMTKKILKKINNINEKGITDTK